MDEDAQRSTTPDTGVISEAKDCDSPDNDVIFINSTIPEVIINDNSCDFSSSFDNIPAIKKESNEIDTKSTGICSDEMDVKNKPGEEQYCDFVILDDDSPQPSVDLEIKQEITYELDSNINKEETPVSDVKPQVKLSKSPVDDKAKNNVVANHNAGASKVEKSKHLPITLDIKLGTNSVNGNSSLRPSLSPNDTFILQLDTTDPLDSYLDKSANEPPRKKPKKDPGSSIKEISLVDDMKENNSNQLNLPPPKVPEAADSLILTADEELETEMSLVVKDKNEKPEESNTEPDKSKETTLEKGLPAVDLQKDIEPEAKTEPAKMLAVDIKNDDNTDSNDKRSVVTETNKLASAEKNSKIEPKKVNTSTANGKKSDLQSSTSRILWVSNVTQSVKATDLKQYISKVGKVMTAKVVTDGKKCYGYVVMDNPEDATECVKTLNNAHFDGKRISLSFTRPTRSVPDKNKDVLKSSEKEKSRSPKADNVTHCISSNDTDDAKVSKVKENQPSVNTEAVKRHRSPSADKLRKRRSSRDPLTTKFTSKKKDNRDYRPKSRSSERHDQKEYVRMERDRLKRRLLEEQRRNRDEMIRQMQREEKQRELEFRLEQERRKLQLEREMFERERRELTRLDAERRKIEKERLEVLQQRTKLEEELHKSRLKQKVDEFNLSSIIVKPEETIKAYDKRKEASKSINGDCGYRKQYDKSDSKHPFQKSSRDIRDDRKVTSDSKGSVSTVHRNVLKSDRRDFKSGKDSRGNSKSSKREDDFKNYERPAPPPPKLTDEFDLSTGRKTKHSEHKHESHADRKLERGGRKIEVIDRKYYSDRSNESSDRKHERLYRKPEFEERKPHSFAERKYEYGREVKRYHEDGYPERDNPQRTQWPTPVSYNNPWKAGLPSTITTSSPVRFQDGNFAAPPYGGPSRIPPFYYHPTPPVPDYPRYDHCPQVAGRKY